MAISYLFVRGQGGSASAEEIASVVPDVDPRALFRVLRFVAGLGVLDMHYTGSDDVRREMIASARHTPRTLTCDIMCEGRGLPQDLHLWAERHHPTAP